MAPTDWLVVVGIAGCLAWPAVSAWGSSVASMLTPRPAAPAVKPAADGQEWRQAWASVVIDLINELESGSVKLDKPEVAARLARELLWQIIGGGGEKPPAK